MKNALLFRAFLYFLLGIGFTYIAIQVVEGSIYNFTTMLLVVMATIDFAVAIRLISLHFKIKNSNEKK
ncbi:YdiK family protein [Thalassobacillus sp. CUG 92003]|uniref:YdiK family protein n=1 Tax=Thalassobacillus sp. CUG 92003 TaxID=2736641 RepID=UPI0015E7B486|nr:YdiK family protein [Thalassobacillus sp. CUG 92003]